MYGKHFLGQRASHDECGSFSAATYVASHPSPVPGGLVHICHWRCVFVWLVNPNSFNSSLWFGKTVMSVLHHTGVTLSCVKLREEMFILIDSRLVPTIQFIWKHHCVLYAFLKRVTVKYLKHAERAPLTDIQVVGRPSEVIMSDNVKGSRSGGTWYLCLFHFFQGEAPAPSCLLVSGQEMPDESQREVKHSSDL